MEITQQSAEGIPEPETTELSMDKTSILELLSTIDSESCEAYISRKVESLELAQPSPNDLISNQNKTSLSDPLTVTPGMNELMPETQVPEDVPRVIFLDRPEEQTEQPQVTNISANTVGITTSAEQPVVILASEVPIDQTGQTRSDANESEEQRDHRSLMDYGSQTDDDSRFGMGTDTRSIERSTLAQALYCPTKHTSIACPHDSSNESSVPAVPAARGSVSLSGSSRAIIKQCFIETNPICLYLGHPTVAFNQDQISSILRIVADDGARASFEMLNSVVQRASQLKLRSPTEYNLGIRLNLLRTQGLTLISLAIP